MKVLDSGYSEKMLFALLRAAIHQREVELDCFRNATEKDWRECYSIAVRQGVAALKGDGSFSTKESCTTGDVIARVEAVIRPSGKIIRVDEWKWKVPSWIWCKLGILKNPILQVMHFFRKS